MIYNENVRILRCLQVDYFEADVARSQMFTSDVTKARNVHGAAFYTLNGKNVNDMLEYSIIEGWYVSFYFLHNIFSYMIQSCLLRGHSGFN